MEEETKRVEANPSTDDTNVDYIEAIKEMRENSVSKDQYNKVVEEKKKLLKTLVEGGTVENPEAIANIKSKDDIKKDIMNSKSNLEWISNALELRNYILENEGKDCFCAENRNVSPTTDDIKDAQDVADLFQTCIDECNGDSNVFTSILGSHINDTPAYLYKNANKK